MTCTEDVVLKLKKEEIENRCQKALEIVKTRYTKRYKELKNINVNLRFGSFKTIAGTDIFNTIRIDYGGAENMSEKESIGLFAHEFGHVMRNKRTLSGVFLQSFENLLCVVDKHILSNKIPTRIEREANILAIKNGFRDELYEITKYLLNTYKEEQLKWFKRTYMSPEEITNYGKEKSQSKKKITPEKIEEVKKEIEKKEIELPKKGFYTKLFK